MPWPAQPNPSLEGRLLVSLMKMCGCRNLWVTLVAFGFLSLCTPVSAGSTPPAEETLLMFVGETEPVVTVASRSPESPTTAPAMVTLVERKQIERQGYLTLGELLADQPGFFMAAGGRGTVPYLRGIRDSILFLYDGVPITTDVTKNFSALDQEISLVAVERVEIVRGPGSVLWGPDAFAGVVNIVPRRNQQHESKMEVGLLGGTDSLYGSTFNGSLAKGPWSAFLSASKVQQKFYLSEFTPADQDEYKNIDDSDYAELQGNLNFSDWLHISGRWSDFTRRYVMGNVDQDIFWAGAKQAPFNQIKVTASKVFGASHYVLTGFIQKLDYRIIDADIARQQSNKVQHLELLWDRRYFKRGLLTAGASWRQNRVNGAVVRDGFLPDLLHPGEDLFVSRVVQEDFSNQLLSAFSQFRYQFGAGEWWAGLRLDDHSQYEKTLSYNVGLHYPLGKNIHAKVIYGTAFRSPYSSQLFNNEQFDPEQIRTISAQFSWFSETGSELEMTLFYNQLENHRSEDPYGGLSVASSWDNYGVELVGSLPLTQSLTLHAGLSLFGDSGRSEQYNDIAYFIRPDGSQVPVIVGQWDEPIDQGVDWIATFDLCWKVGPEESFHLTARDGGESSYSYNKGESVGHYPYPLLLGLTYRRPGFFKGLDSLTLKATNLLDHDYQLPDVFGPIAGPPLEVSLVWQIKF